MAIADGPDSGGAAVGGQAQSFKLTDEKVGVGGCFHGYWAFVLYKDRQHCAYCVHVTEQNKKKSPRPGTFRI